MGPEEEAQFAVYVTARRDRVRRTAYLICGDWHKADDLAQIAFVKLYGAWQRIRDYGALDAYVRSCLMRAAVDESRRPWRRERPAEVLPERAGGAATEPVGGHAAPDFAALVVDRELMRAALRHLPDGQRAMVVLRYYEGLSVAEVAAAMDCSEGNVKSQTSRGLAALRAALVRSGSVEQAKAGGDAS